VRLEFVIFLIVLFIVNAHLQVREIFLFIKVKLNRGVSLNKLLFLMKSLAIEFILIIYDKVIRAVREGHHRSVRETPPEASGHSHCECQLVVLRGELCHIKDMGVEAGDLLQSFILRLVLFFVFHDLCFEERVFKEIQIFWIPIGRKVTILGDLEIWVPH
jgi:hypothetical protein